MTGDTTVSLRAELGGQPDPDFSLRLLPGWTRWEPDGDQMKKMGRQVRDRLAAVGRTDLAPEAHGLVLSSFQERRKQDVIAGFSATADRDDTIWLPGSPLATIRRRGPHHNLDE